MSVEFRQRKPSEYAAMLWRRKWLIVLPAVAIGLAVAWAVWKLPDVYESTTLLTVRPPSISPSIVPQLSSDDLSTRINSIGQEVVSRSSLEPLILKYNLYATERARGEAMDALVERMRTRDISVKINTSRNDVTNAFFLNFRGADPKTTQAVTAELASKYTRAQQTASQGDATQTRELFERRLQEAKQRVDEIDSQRIRYMTQNPNSLPSVPASLLGQLAGLREQQRTLTVELGRMRDQRALLETQIGDLKKQRQQEIDNIVTALGRPKETLAYVDLAKRKAELEAAKKALQTQLREKHPDVIGIQSQIDSVQKQMDEMINESKERVAEKQKQLESQIDPRLDTIKYNIRFSEGEIGRLQGLLASTEGRISDIEGRMDDLPEQEVGLEQLNREYQTAKALYDDALKQSEQANLISQVQSNAQGESIAVIDSANLPERPVAPKRPLLMLLGLVVGLFTGLAFAAAFEIPKLLTIQNREDAEHYTGLPVLVTLPEMRTPREERLLRTRRVWLASAGLVAAVLSVPALAFLLHVTHALELLTFRG